MIETKRKQSKNKIIAAVIFAVVVVVSMGLVLFLPAQTVSASELIYQPFGGDLIERTEILYDVPGKANIDVEGSSYLDFSPKSVTVFLSVYLEEGQLYAFSYCGELSRDAGDGYLFYSTYPLSSKYGGGTGYFLLYGSYSSSKRSEYFLFKGATGLYKIRSKSCGTYDSSPHFKGYVSLTKCRDITPSGEQIKPQFVTAGYDTSGQYVLSDVLKDSTKSGVAEFAVFPNVAYRLDWNGTAKPDFSYTFNCVEFGDVYYSTYGSLYFVTKDNKIRVNTLGSGNYKIFPCLNICSFSEAETAENFMLDAVYDIDNPAPPSEPSPDEPIVTPDNTDKPTVSPENTDKPDGGGKVDTTAKNVDVGEEVKAWFMKIGDWFETLWTKISVWFSELGSNIGGWFKTAFGGNDK